MDTEIKEAEQNTEHFNVTFVFGTAVVGVGVVMPEGTAERLRDDDDGLANEMVQASADELQNTYGFDVNAHDLQDVIVEDAQ